MPRRPPDVMDLAGVWPQGRGSVDMDGEGEVQMPVCRLAPAGPSGDAPHYHLDRAGRGRGGIGPANTSLLMQFPQASVKQGIVARVQMASRWQPQPEKPVMDFQHQPAWVDGRHTARDMTLKVGTGGDVR